MATSILVVVFALLILVFVLAGVLFVGLGVACTLQEEDSDKVQKGEENPSDETEEAIRRAELEAFQRRMSYNSLDPFGPFLF